MPKFHDHDIKYVEDVSQEHHAKIDDEGNVVVNWDSNNVLAIHETSIWCDTCGIQIGDSQDYLDHGLSEDWQAV